MKKYIIIIIFLLLGAGVVFLASNHTEENVETNTPIIQEVHNQTEQEEYVVDSSDIYSVDPPESDTLINQLTENEKKWLVHMREEEKLARDVYTTLGDRWGVQIFSNIAVSEQTHTDSVKVLLERYGIADPVTNNTIGVFVLPEIQALYNELIAKGSMSPLDALVVGATIEDLDIYDLETAVSETQKSDINTVYANLQKGSRNHMRAFVRNINRQGGVYIPAYISEEEYQNIIDSEQERDRIQ